MDWSRLPLPGPLGLIPFPSLGGTHYGAPTINAKPKATTAPSTPKYSSSSRYVPGPPVYNESYSADSPNNPYAAIVKAISSTSSKSAIPQDAWTDPYAGMDPEKMVRREFDPQYSLISQMEGQAKDKYTRAGNDIGQGWDLLAKSIAGRQKGIQADVTARGKASDAGWAKVGQNSNNAIDQARASLIADAQRNGTMEQIAPLLANLASKQAELSSESGSRGANWASFNTAQGANEVAANRLASDNAKWAGIGARADFSNRLLDALNQLGNKRLEIKGNEGAAFNKYGMDLAGARDSSKNAWETIQTQRAAQAIEMEKAQAAAAAANQPKAIDPSKLTASEYLAYVAKGLYSRPGEGTGRSENAANAVMDVFRQGKGWKNVQAFIDDVMKHNPQAQNAGGDARQLAQLASDYYIKVAGGPNRAYGTNITP